MANIIPATDILGVSGLGMYLGADEKAELHNEQRPFWISGAVAEQEGQYGVQTVFTIREKGKDEQRLAFSASLSRIDQAKKISQAVANGVDAVGPFYLGRWEANGRSGWALTGEPTKPQTIPPNSNQTSTTSTPAKQASTPVDYDSDVPF